MKKYFVISLAALFLISCGNKVVDVVAEKFPDGAKKTVKRYKIDGKDSVLLKETVYYQTQQKYMEGNFLNGKRDSVWTAWLSNGQVWSKGSYKNGLEDGPKEVYHETGFKYYEGQFKEGKRGGKWLFYTAQGKLVKHIDYDANPPQETILQN
jgi:antitoxin component YwqK of YwqJK toxin-antitoxin module